MTLFDESIRTLRDIVRALDHRDNGPVPDDEYQQIVAADAVNRILHQTEYQPPKRGRPRKHERGHPLLLRRQPPALPVG